MSTPWMSWICWTNHCVKASSPAPSWWKARAGSAPSAVARQLAAGTLSTRAAARRLGVGWFALDRLLAQG